MKNATVLAIAILIFLGGVGMSASADDTLTEPLLIVLVEQEVITLEQALAVQRQYEAEKNAPTDDVASAPVVAADHDTNTESWTDRMNISGDVRMRYEGFSKDHAFDDGRRDRFRTRVRAGLTADVTERLRFGLQLRNGDPDDPVSNNTSFDGAFQFKDFNLAQAYLEYQGDSGFGMIAGKFDAKKRWKVSDMQWDDDVTVEGLMENFDFGFDGSVVDGLEIATYQYILEESGSGDDSYVFGAQLHGNFILDEYSRLAVGGGFDYWENPQGIVDLSQSGKLAGNAVTNVLDDDGQLVSDFEIANLFVEYKYGRSKKWPLKVNLFYYQNLGAQGVAKNLDTAYFGRLQLGDYKEPGDVALRYSYYESDPDALMYVFAQSDTSRGSDLQAHRFDLRIGMVAKSYFNLTWYKTEHSFADDDSLDRWQVDYIVKF